MDLFCLQSFFFLLLSLFAYFFLSHKPSEPPLKNGFKIYPFVGILPDFLKNRHRMLDWTTEVLKRCPNNTGKLWRPGKPQSVLTANPSNVEHILKTNFHNYPKGDLFRIPLQDFLGSGIFNSDGDLWKVQRKTASYEFNTNSLRHFIVQIVTVEIHTRLLPILAKAAETSRVLDMQSLLEQFAFDNICKLSFNLDPSCLGIEGRTKGSEFMQAFEDAAALSSGRSFYFFPLLWKIKRYLNVGTEQRLKESISIVRSFADKIIQSRLEGREDEITENEDLLSRFMKSVNEFNSPQFLRDIIISFILAGRDTTSSALSWFFWLLSSKPEVKRNILKELEATRKRNGKSLGEMYSFEELKEMQYLQAAISEAMRLYPPVPLDSKKCEGDDTLPDGTVVRKGWMVTYHTYAMGRMEGIWGKDCGEYKPERWVDENGICRHESPFKFPVFHAGPRICLGKDLAFIQMKAIAASVMERFEVEVENEVAEPLMSLTLRMKGGLQVRVKERRLHM